MVRVANRLFRFALIAALLSPAFEAGEAMARGLLPAKEHNRLATRIDHRPMMFFLAKGPVDSCGTGCSEWIAAVGSFDNGTTQRFRDFIGKMNGRNLPVFFHSAGGLAKSAIEVGYILRERRMSAGIGRTDTKCRVSDKRAACQSLIKAGQGIAAKLYTNDAQCHSACVLAFIGASSRRVASDAWLGVHSGRLLKSSPRKVSPAFLNQISRRYYLEMGVDPTLVDIEAKTPHERIYILSRSELARFGLETRAEIYETPWRSSDVVEGKFVVMKAVTVKSPVEQEYLTYLFHFGCVAPTGKPNLIYKRELTLHSGRINKKVELKFGDEDFAFIAQQNSVGVEIGVAKSLGSLAKLADAKAMTLIEKRTVASPAPWPGMIDIASETKLSTAGLAEGLEELRKHCVPPASDRRT